MIDDVGSSFTEKEYFSEGVRGGVFECLSEKRTKRCLSDTQSVCWEVDSLFFLPKKNIFQRAFGVFEWCLSEKRGVYLTPALGVCSRLTPAKNFSYET